jgi:hypothetical protein
LFGRPALLKKRWLLTDRLGMEEGLACRSMELKLLCEGDTGFAPVITLAWRKVPGSIRDCCIETREFPN